MHSVGLLQGLNGICGGEGRDEGAGTASELFGTYPPPHLLYEALRMRDECEGDPEFDGTFRFLDNDGYLHGRYRGEEAGSSDESPGQDHHLKVTMCLSFFTLGTYQSKSLCLSDTEGKTAFYNTVDYKELRTVGFQRTNMGKGYFQRRLSEYGCRRSAVFLKETLPTLKSVSDR